MKRLLTILTLIAVAACTKGTDRPVVSQNATMADDGVQRINVAMHSYYFEPNRIVVKRDVPVEIVLSNSSHIVPHNFTLNGAGVNVSEDKWGWGHDTVRFTPTQTGEFEFVCHKGDHAKKGMVGTLVVTE